MTEPEDLEDSAGPQTGMNSREYIRVPSECPVIYRMIDPLAPKRSPKKSGPPIPTLLPFDLTQKYGTEEGLNPQIVELILWLDWKMNYLFKTLTRTKDSEVFSYQAILMDLSATGMRFSTPKEISAKTLLEFEFILPILPFQEIVLTGEVIRCIRAHDNAPEEYEIAVEFSQIKESDREQIIRYVVKRQLQLQRERPL
ncbi:MAG: PilZ domain-containing protein [Nitrospirae bacterium]|nr:PilZ domain-containing protein [Candidatus Manganitrophaceae bacterium]